MRTRILTAVIGASVCCALSYLGAEPAFVGDNHTVLTLGTATVNLPLPDHFVEGTSRSALIKQLNDAGILPTADSLGCYVDDGDLRRFDAAEASLPFWTKVVVLKRLRDKDVTPQDLAKIRIDASAKMADALDPANPKMQQMLKQIQASLTRLPAGGVSYDLSKPINLGIVESSDNSFTSLMLSSPTFKVGNSEEAVPILTATTFLLCKNRLLFIYSSQNFKTTTDVSSLTHFVESWIRKIKASN